MKNKTYYLLFMLLSILSLKVFAVTPPDLAIAIQDQRAARVIIQYPNSEYKIIDIEQGQQGPTIIAGGLLQNFIQFQIIDDTPGPNEGILLFIFQNNNNLNWPIVFDDNAIITFYIQQRSRLLLCISKRDKWDCSRST